ncbi:hypothetical protein J1614_003361 [Plenodomus biglobosus]|nr:hypothetical protein J1614_003361 [Plenodomus biglobosus]
MIGSNYLSLLTLFAGAAKAQFTHCPTAEELTSTADGSIYAICQQTDYQGETVKLIHSVATLFDCVAACNKDGKCTRAVYNKASFQCHLKAASGLNWSSSTVYTSVRFASKPKTGSTIRTCPTAETNVTMPNGAILATCPNTDYQGNTLKDIWNIKSASDCATACGNTAGCVRAVYKSAASVCYLKDRPRVLRWIYNPGFTSVRTISNAPVASSASISVAKSSTVIVIPSSSSAPAPSASTLPDGTRLTSCPAGLANVTTANGLTFATCQSADFNADSIEILSQVTSVKACAEACSTRKDCVHASFDTKDNVCHIKGKLTSPIWMVNKVFWSLQLASAGSVPSASSASTASSTSTASSASVAPSTSASPIANTNKGRWSAVIQFPIIPVAAYVVPADPAPARLLVFSSYGARAFGGPTGITQFADYNFNTGAVSQRTITNTRHDMFCPGISLIDGGKIVITGGSNAEAVSIYDPATNQFTRAADMQIARGYQTSTTLSDGRIFTIGGSYSGGISNKRGEVYDPAANKWTLLPGADSVPLLTTDHEGAWRTDNHAWLYSWRNGTVFQAGPSKAMNWYSTSGSGSVTPAGTRTGAMDQMCAVNVMYDAGKILSAGGSQDYSNSPATTMTHRITITDPGVPATVEVLADMHFARGFANAVVLPSGQVLVTGGQTRTIVFTDIDSVLVPELWDPKTETWTQLAPAAVPRNYHSVSLLLPDGTVFVGGGGMCPAAQGDNLAWCDRAKDHFDGEIFSPPYLFAADGELAVRPVVESVSAARVVVGATIKVVLKDGLQDASFALVRMGSATHSINSDQRRLPLGDVQGDGKGSYTIRLPNDSGVMIPGSWYLFAMSKEGVPSLARTLSVSV